MTDPIIRLDNYHTETMGYPLAEAKPNEIHVVASERRLRKEEGYGVLPSGCCLAMTQGQTCVSVLLIELVTEIWQNFDH